MGFKQYKIQVDVREPVRGLSIQGSCAAIPVGEKKLFVANILMGNPVRFLWTFDLHHHKATHLGKEVWSLTCHLSTFAIMTYAVT